MAGSGHHSSSYGHWLPTTGETANGSFYFLYIGSESLLNGRLTWKLVRNQTEFIGFHVAWNHLLFLLLLKPLITRWLRPESES